ncbi:MAG: hypothetical protein HKN47_00950, partial [Pirellulaceae bacterium]|nr:hypothetical protein [Pirellulaceae bacterium]
RLVCFEDFGPTVLSLAGAETLPAFMRGQPFIGPLAKGKREYVFGHRDRVDEIMDLSRSVRNRNYLYIRNFMPHLGWNQQNAWCDQGEIRDAFYDAAESGTATEAQMQYLRASRPREELYDCVADPLNLTNLADRPEQSKNIDTLRAAMDQHLRQSHDLGFVHEIDLWQVSAGSTPIQWGQDHQEYIDAARRAAMSLIRKDPQEILKHLNDPNASVRYWGCIGCRGSFPLTTELTEKLTELLEDRSAAVQIEAAGALAESDVAGAGSRNAARKKLVRLLKHSDTTVLLHAARTVELLADPHFREPMQRLADSYAEAPGDMAWFIRFSTSGYLNRLK